MSKTAAVPTFRAAGPNDRAVCNLSNLTQHGGIRLIPAGGTIGRLGSRTWVTDGANPVLRCHCRRALRPVAIVDIRKLEPLA